MVGDFSANGLADWARIAPEHALELVCQTSCGKGRNSADIALTIRAMDLLAAEVFRSFLLVSSDCDFAPLALRIRRSGLAVYGMGEAKSGSAWRNSCTTFFELAGKRQLNPAAAPSATPAAADKSTATANPAWSEQDRQALRNILRKHVSGGTPWVQLQQLGQTVHRESRQLGARLGNGRLLKNLRADTCVELRGQGSSIEVRLKEGGKNGPTTELKRAPPPVTVRSGSVSEAMNGKR